MTTLWNSLSRAQHKLSFFLFFEAFMCLSHASPKSFTYNDAHPDPLLNMTCESNKTNDSGVPHSMDTIQAHLARPVIGRSKFTKEQYILNLHCSPVNCAISSREPLFSHGCTPCFSSPRQRSTTEQRELPYGCGHRRTIYI